MVAQADNDGRIAVARSMREAGRQADLLARLDAALRGTAPSRDTDQLLARARRHMNVPDGVFTLTVEQLREASVLVPVVRRPEGPTVLFTRRAESLRQHAGQISFPGGAVEAADVDATAAALRETHEETGITPAHVRVCGWLDPYLTLTGFCVTPVVGQVTPDFELKPDPAEVAEVFEMPLEYALDPANRTTESRTYGGHEFSFYRIEYDRHVIWGATAGMLVNLAERLAEDT